MAKRKLFYRLFPSYLAIILLTLLVAAWCIGRVLTNFYLEQLQNKLEERCRIVAIELSRLFQEDKTDKFQEFCKTYSQFDNTRVTIIDPAGTVLGDSERNPEEMENHKDRPEIKDAFHGQAGHSIRYSPTLREYLMYVAVPVPEKDSPRVVLRISLKVNWIDSTLGNIYRKIAIYGLGVAIAGIILSGLMSKMITRPIYELRDGAARFAQGKFDQTLPIPDIEEIGSLAESMNHMAGEINQRIVEVTEQRNRLDAILSSMVEGVVAVDAEQRILRLNRSASRQFRLPSDPDPVGKLFYEVVRNAAFQAFVDRVLAEKRTIEDEITFFDTDQRVFTVHGTVLNGATGKCGGALVVLNDVTRIRKLEKLRSEFVANVSHEIKTPLTAIKASVETMLDGDIKDRKDREKLLKIIVRHSERLGSIVDDLLSLSRLEQVQQPETEMKSVNLDDILDSAIELCREKAGASDVRIQKKSAGNLCLNADTPLIEQALVNLIDNAIKYSNSGGTITVEADQNDKDLTISVIDQGCGIPEEHLSRIFERFYRVDKARSRKLGGTGLGLSIVKHIMEVHAGRVEVRSEVGKGSRFTLSFPVG